VKEIEREGEGGTFTYKEGSERANGAEDWIADTRDILGDIRKRKR